MVIVSEYCRQPCFFTKAYVPYIHVQHTFCTLYVYSRVTYIDELMFGVGAGYLADVEGDVERCGNNRSDMTTPLGLRSFEIIKEKKVLKKAKN